MCVAVFAYKHLLVDVHLYVHVHVSSVTHEYMHFCAREIGNSVFSADFSHPQGVVIA